MHRHCRSRTTEPACSPVLPRGHRHLAPAAELLEAKAWHVEPFLSVLPPHCVRAGRGPGVAAPAARNLDRRRSVGPLLLHLVTRQSRSLALRKIAVVRG